LGTAQEDETNQRIEQNEEIVLDESEGGHLALVLWKQDDPERNGGRPHRVGTVAAKKMIGK
jgi:hypothetical protein